MHRGPQPSSRRRFLKQTFFGAVALSAGALIPASTAAVEVPEEIKRRLRFFSPHEYAVMTDVAARIIGRPSEGGVDVALRADGYLAGADSEIQEQMHQLFGLFDSVFIAFLFDFRFSSFLNMSSQDQSSYIADWMNSRLGFRRTVFQALKRTSLSMYYTDPLSWGEIGYRGMFLPEDRQ